ncbi:MAG TPA: carboxypeptidase-like regulatory domain-containing protein [Nocardioidaceae bacterium]|nr:carboxypeptidase-like regulatory domain-containing protein [Nocardioidaceae bacterium]
MNGATSWRRFALLLVPSLVAVAGFGAAVASGVLAASIQYQAGNATLSTMGVYGIDGAVVVSEIERQTGPERTIRLAVAQALINEICLSEPILGGAATLTVTAGDGDPRTWETTGNSAVIDASQAKTSLAMDGAVLLGTDATTVDTGPHDLGAKTGYIGIEAGFVDARGLLGTAAAVRLSGIVEVPHITFKIVPGGGASSGCQRMPEPTYGGQRVNPPAAGSISGVVRDAGGTPIPGVRVALFNPEGELNAVLTDANGAYRIFAFVGKEVKVQFKHRRYAERWNGGALIQHDAHPIAITSTATLTGVNASMPICPTPAPC